MIIGLSGYIGVGKDEVGRIIQYLTTSKSQISYDSYIIDKGVGMTLSPSWKIKKFAGKLKQIASLLTGISIHKFEDQEFKKSFLGKEWNTTFGGDGYRKMTVRELLQKLGTDGLRDNLHEDVWVNALFSDYHEKYDISSQHYNSDGTRTTSIYPEASQWIITDCRFPNEARAIKERDGIMIRVNRGFDDLQIGDNQIRIQREPHTLHSSETALDDWKFDEVIDNKGSIEELIGKVREILERRKII